MAHKIGTKVQIEIVDHYLRYNGKTGVVVHVNATTYGIRFDDVRWVQYFAHDEVKGNAHDDN